LRYISKGDLFQPEHDANMIQKFQEMYWTIELQDDLVEHHWRMHIEYYLCFFILFNSYELWCVWFWNFFRYIYLICFEYLIVKVCNNSYEPQCA
jgi:hypothetical protein